MSIAKQFEETLAASGKSAQQQMNHWGLTLAVVTNVNDEQKLNRVKCLPIMNEQKEETDWCYVMSPFAGKNHGQFFFPNVDDLVILGYIDGDPHRPVVLGGYWNNETTPPYTIEEGKIHNYSIKTPSGTELLFYDEPDKQKVTLTLPSGAVLSVDDEKKTATLSDKNADNALVINFEKGEIKLSAKTKLTLSAGAHPSCWNPPATSPKSPAPRFPWRPPPSRARPAPNLRFPARTARSRRTPR